METPPVPVVQNLENPPPPPRNNGRGLFSRCTWSKKEVKSKLEKAWWKLLKLLCNSMIRLAISTTFTLFVSFMCWLFYFHPHTLNPEVDSAALVALDLAGGPRAAAGEGGGDGIHQEALLYDLALNVTFANKFSISKIHFQHLTAGLYYGGAKIGPTDDTVPSFKLRQEASRTVRYTLPGRASNVSAAVAETFARERAQGQFNLNVGLTTMLTYRFFPHKISYYYRYACWLQFPPVPGDGSITALAGAFECSRVKSKY